MSLADAYYWKRLRTSVTFSTPVEVNDRTCHIKVRNLFDEDNVHDMMTDFKKCALSKTDAKKIKPMLQSLDLKIDALPFRNIHFHDSNCNSLVHVENEQSTHTKHNYCVNVD